MTLSLLGGLAGGIGLFLLGMGLMTDGLKLAAGPALERILASSTKTRIRGLASGILVTAVVQSSSAVTVATIGFVNAGLLNLSQALWVLFGANVGTTMTGWLVALVGLKFKIEALALPLIGVGMILRLTGDGHRRGALGMALAGFGVLFLGIDMLKETFSGLSTDFRLPEGQGVIDTLMQVGIGITLTVLMQSSSAALVIALTAAQGGLLGAQGAAAVVIGANIGTTVTALIAALGATPNAKRAAAAHILFNLLTGCVALLLLPWLIGALSLLREWLGLDEAPAANLALFHTAFNVLGVFLIWPVAARLTHFLESRFRPAEDDEGRPRHLDKTVLAVPALALDALEREVRHMGGIAITTVSAVLSQSDGPALARNKTVVASLNRAIAEFIVELNRAGMSPDSARRLPQILRLARYYESAVSMADSAAMEAAVARGESTGASVDLAEAEGFRQAALSLIELCAQAALTAPSPRIGEVQAAMEAAYQALKARLLEAGAQGQLPVAVMDAQLRSASNLRRALEQVAKASNMLTREATPVEGG
jgi:phosphate:Na+ symporter